MSLSNYNIASFANNLKNNGFLKAVHEDWQNTNEKVRKGLKGVASLALVYGGIHTFGAGIEALISQQTIFQTITNPHLSYVGVGSIFGGLAFADAYEENRVQFLEPRTKYEAGRIPTHYLPRGGGIDLY